MTYSERTHDRPSWGDVRAVAHEGRPLDMMRAAARCRCAQMRRYLADNARRRGAAAWQVEYMRDLDAHALVPLASWSRPDPLESLEEGVLSLDGEQFWTVPDERPGLEWSVAELWSVLPLWETWAVEHAPDCLAAPRRAVEALDGLLRREVSVEDLDAASAAARHAARHATRAAATATGAVGRHAAWNAASAAATATIDAGRHAAWSAASASAATATSWDAARERQRAGWTAHALHCAMTGRWS